MLWPELRGLTILSRGLLLGIAQITLPVWCHNHFQPININHLLIWINKDVWGCYNACLIVGFDIWARGGASQQFNNTLCHNCGRGQNFQLWACWKKATCGREEQPFEKGFWTEIYSQESWWRQPKTNCERIIFTKICLNFWIQKPLGFLCDIFWISHYILCCMLHVALLQLW